MAAPSFVAASSSQGTGSTSASCAYPTGIQLGDLLVLTVTNKYPTNGPSTPSGWTAPSGNQASGGSGASGVDTGQVYSTVFYKVADGTETGNLTVNVTSGNSMQIRIHAYRPTISAFSTWDIACVSGSDNTGGTGWSVTTGSLDVAVDDVVLAASAINSNAYSYSSQSLAITGATFSAAVERSDLTNTSGDDTSMVVTEHTVTAGATDTATYTMTASGSATDAPAGATVLFRFREVEATQGVVAFQQEVAAILDDVPGQVTLFAQELAVLISNTITPTTVAATTTIGTVTIEAGSTVAPSTVLGSTTIDTPTIDTGGTNATATPSTVDGVATVGAPTVSGSALATPSTVDGVTTIGTPTIDTGGTNATATPSTVAATTTIGTVIVPVFLFTDGTATLGGVTADATVVDGRVDVFAATITSPGDGDSVVAGGVAVYVSVLSGDNTAVDVQVDLSSSPAFEAGGVDENENPVFFQSNIDGPVDPGEVAVLTMTGLVAGTVYYLRARSGHDDTDLWGDWSETVQITATDEVGDGFLWLYGSDVDASEPYPHLWSAHLEGDTVVMIGAGFGDPQSQYNGEARATYYAGLVSMTVSSWDRVAATGDATTADRTIDYQRTADCEHDEVRCALPAGADQSGVGVYIRIEEI